MARRPGGLIEEELTRSVIGAFFDVYNTLGYSRLIRPLRRIRFPEFDEPAIRINRLRHVPV